MKRMLVAFSTAFVGAGLVVGTGVAAASPAPPVGYETKTVKAAGLTVAVPETFVYARLTREEAKALLDANPHLRETGVTVDAVRKLFSMGGDFDGDGKGDFGINVRAFPLGPKLSLEQLTALGYREVSVSRTRVAGRRARVFEYVETRTLEDGTTRDVHSTEYVFESPRINAPVHIIFVRPAGDGQYEDMIDTMIDSVRFVKR